MVLNQNLADQNSVSRVKRCTVCGAVYGRSIGTLERCDICGGILIDATQDAFLQQRMNQGFAPSYSYIPNTPNHIPGHMNMSSNSNLYTPHVGNKTFLKDLYENGLIDTYVKVTYSFQEAYEDKNWILHYGYGTGMYGLKNEITQVEQGDVGRDSLTLGTLFNDTVTLLKEVVLDEDSKGTLDIDASVTYIRGDNNIDSILQVIELDNDGEKALTASLISEESKCIDGVYKKAMLLTVYYLNRELILSNEVSITIEDVELEDGNRVLYISSDNSKTVRRVNFRENTNSIYIYDNINLLPEEIKYVYSLRLVDSESYKIAVDSLKLKVNYRVRKTT